MIMRYLLVSTVVDLLSEEGPILLRSLGGAVYDDSGAVTVALIEERRSAAAKRVASRVSTSQHS